MAFCLSAMSCVVGCFPCLITIALENSTTPYFAGGLRSGAFTFRPTKSWPGPNMRIAASPCGKLPWQLLQISTLL